MMVKYLVKMMVTLLVAGWVFAVFVHSGKPRNRLSRTEATSLTSDVAKEPVSEQSTPKESASKEPTSEDAQAVPAFAPDELVRPSALLVSIKDYVDTPKGGIDWQLFGQTKERPYSYSDKAGTEWTGVRPEFPDKLKRLDGREVLVKGFMFPLLEDEEQPHFLLGPFPVACPFHYDVTPNLLIEVHTERPVTFSYDAVNIKGKLELVPQDDEYNVFYRLKKAKRVP